MTKALFLDRDGVVNVDVGYLYKKEDFMFMPHITDLMRFMQEKGFLIVIVTNQSGINRGYYTLEQFLDLTDFIFNRCKKLGINIAKTYHCPHTPDEDCECRKPKPKMFLDAIKDLQIDPAKSIMIGDKDSDIKAATGAGVGTTFLLTKQNSLQDIMATLQKEIQ